MRIVSDKFKTGTWVDWHGTKCNIPALLKIVANTFIMLQNDRHKADYDNHHEWTFTSAERVIKLTNLAFQSWESIRSDPMAGNYLIAMLLGKPRI